MMRQQSVENLLEIRGHSVAFGGRPPVVQDVSFDIPQGQIVAIVGESGSGKSVLARSLVNLAGHNAHVTTESYEFAGRNMKRVRGRQWRSIRGEQIGFILQDALVSLDPLRKLEDELGDGLRIHRGLSREQRRKRITDVLTRLQLDNAEARLRRYSGELSGGQRQRMLIASAMVNAPKLLIADEVTSALDAIVQRDVIEALSQLRDDGTTILFISHDLALVRSIADRVIVMRHGRIVDQGQTEQVITAATSEYTKLLIRATQLPEKPAARVHRSSEASAVSEASEREQVLRLEDVSYVYPTPDGQGFRALDEVNLRLYRGETLGLVGESGSGKSTLAALALGLAEPTSGQLSRPNETDRPFAWIPQDTLDTFDPRHRVGQILLQAVTGGRAVGRYQLRARRYRAARAQILEYLETVGLGDVGLHRYPRQMSGGQRQRLAIARALATGARVLICDEPVSALDAQYRSGILQLLNELQEKMGLSLLFITHDLAVVRAVSDRVAVLKAGQILETRPTAELFADPNAHPYTKRLLQAAY